MSWPARTAPPIVSVTRAAIPATRSGAWTDPPAILALTILAVNVLGDALRDKLDPKLARRI